MKLFGYKIIIRKTQPRDSNGRFSSKKKSMTEQLKLEVANLRKAGM